MLFIFLGRSAMVKSFWSQQASFEIIQRYILDSDEVTEAKKKNKTKKMSVMVPGKWQPAAPSLLAINLRGILIIHNCS